MENVTVENAVRASLETFVSGAIKISEEHMQLQEKRQGTYVSGVMAAILAGTGEAFEAEIQSFMDDIRANKGGYARKLGCKVAKRQPKGQPKNRPVYVVPSSVSALKTYMLQAFQFEVDLGTAEEPRTFRKIRDDVNVIRANKAKEALTGDDAIRVEIEDSLDAIESRLEKLSGEALANVKVAVIDALATARLGSGIDAQRAAKAEEKAAKADVAPASKTSKKTASKKSKKKASKKTAKRTSKAKEENQELAKAA